MEVSPYLSAIQSLKGKTASEKYKKLHSIVAEILKNDEEKTQILQSGVTDRVPAALCPTLHVLVGMRLKLNEAVIHALKSSDSSINKQGLKAKWFFKASNNLINVNYLTKEVIPFISLQTRLELIKKLAKCLKTEPEKANDFFQKFVELYGGDETMLILFACSEEFIYQEILKRRIHIPVKKLKVLYEKYPQLAIRYLQLGNETNKSNLEDRKLFKISLMEYSKFFPILLKNHTQEFIEFFRYYPETFVDYVPKLGITGTKLFLKKAVDTLIEKPRVFLPILSLKVVTEKLSHDQFNTMFRNLLPENLEKWQMTELILHLKYCSKDKAYEIFSTNYKAVYNKEFLDCRGILSNARIADIIPLDIKVKLCKKYNLEKPGKDGLIPIKDALPLYTEKINEAASDDDKIMYVSYLIYSARLYEDKDGLLEVLKYFNNHLKNQSAAVLQSFLERMYTLIDLSSLDKEHWKVLAEIIQRGYITGDLFVKIKNDDDIEFDPKIILCDGLHHFLKRCQKDDAEESEKQFLNTFVNANLEGYCEHELEQSIVPKSEEIREDCLRKFLEAVPSKYPESHAVWKNSIVKLKLISNLIASIVYFNKKTTGTTKYSIQDYPWLVQFAKDLLMAKSELTTKYDLIYLIQYKSYAKFLKYLRGHDLQLYQSIIDNDANLINDVTTNDALILLKKDSDKILNKWSLYLSACKEGLLKGSRAARIFVASCKWYQELPVNFVGECLKNVDDKANLLVLAILLEGDAFIQIIQPFLSKEMQTAEDAKKAYKILSTLPTTLKFNNTPVPLEALTPLCQDHLQLAKEALTLVAHRTPADRVLTFAKTLMNKSLDMKLVSVGLMYGCVEKADILRLLSDIVNDGKYSKDKRLIAEMIFTSFIQTPCEETWLLMRNFIQQLSAQDEFIFDILQDFEVVDSAYISEYTKILFMKINELKKYQKKELMLTLVNELETVAGILSEDVLSFIIKHYFFDLPYEFLFDNYLFSSQEKFESRLDLVVEILTGSSMQCQEPESKIPKIYPADQRIKRFFSKTKLFRRIIDKNRFLGLEMCFPKDDEQEMKLRFINRMLDIPKINDDLLIYLNLNAYKIYFEESDPKKFGEKCCENVKMLCEKFDRESVINNYGDAMSSLLDESMKFTGKTLDIIDGMKSCDLDISVSMVVKLLNTFDVSKYDKRYNDFINVSKEKFDDLSCAALNKFSGNVSDDSF